MNNELIKLTEAELEDLVTIVGIPALSRKNRFTSGFTAIMQLPSMPCPTIPKDLRAKLSEFFPLEMVKIFDRQVSLDGTRKYVMTLADGSLVETVGMPVYHRDGSP